MNQVLLVSPMLIALGGLSLWRLWRDKTSPWRGGEATAMDNDSGEP
jgi:hypothetical protein